ncbi:hypothetical protein [Agromyces aureus]|uniref:hypothetical protein n=1 Tax=Agromyces aureus TaxID=453304 RepID=UPI001D103F2A|nr:hypothetical protein [Agromyces aureus]
MHSAEQARAIIVVDCIIDIITPMSQPCTRSIIFIMVSHMSAQFEHIEAQRPMPSAASASAHMTHACMHAERASRHSCIIIGSMPCIGISDDDIAPFIMSIVMFIAARSLPGPRVPAVAADASAALLRHVTSGRFDREGVHVTFV